MDNPKIDTRRLLQITPGLIDPTAPYSSNDPPQTDSMDFNPLERNTISASKPRPFTNFQKPRPQKLVSQKLKKLPERDPESESPLELSYEEIMCEKLDRYLQSLKSLRSDLQKLKPNFNIPSLLERSKLGSFYSPQKSPTAKRKIVLKKPKLPPRTPSVPLGNRKFVARRYTKNDVKTAAAAAESTVDIFKREGIQERYIAVFPKLSYRRRVTIAPFTASGAAGAGGRSHKNNGNTLLKSPPQMKLRVTCQKPKPFQ